MHPPGRHYPRLYEARIRPAQDSHPGAPRPAGERGFTLVEAMIATLIFVMFTLGVYALIIQSYNMTARIRYRDDARAMLQTFADQFVRLQTTTYVEATKTSYTRWMFNPTGTNAPTGLGLRWGALCDEDAYNNPLPDPVPGDLTVTLGGDKTPITAHVTREVYFVLPTGETSTTLSGSSVTAAGWLIAGKFSINYVANGRAETASMTVVRSVP
jgi:type II secretory pathway pseudopilin PulG